MKDSDWYFDSIVHEQLVLGLMMYPHGDQYDAIDRAATIVTADDFWRETHQILYRTILELREAGKSCDFIAIYDRIREGKYASKWSSEQQLLDDMREMSDRSVGIYEYGLETHCEAIRAGRLKRSLHEMAHRIILGCSERTPSTDLAGDAERTLTDAVSRIVKDSTSPISQSLAGYGELLNRRRQGGGTGLKTGLARLDLVLGGLKAGELVVLAARPSIGKSALAMAICMSVAKLRKSPSLFISLEMSREQLLDRMVAATACVGLSRLIEANRFDSADQKRIDDAIAELRTYPISIDDAPRRTLSQIAASARRHRRDGLELLCIDYLQLVAIEAEHQRRGASREEAVAGLSRRLKELARELQIPVLCLCQLNRQAEGRSDHKPQLADLRESGAIEQDADRVLLLHRPNFYDSHKRPNEADIIVAKNRNGRTATIAVAYRGEFVRFASLESGEA